MALIEIDGFRYSDLRSFASCFGLSVPRINGYGVGIRHPLAPGAETTLDTEVLTAAAPGLKGIDVYDSLPRASDVLLSLTAPLQNAGPRPGCDLGLARDLRGGVADLDREQRSSHCRRRAGCRRRQRDLDPGFER